MCPGVTTGDYDGGLKSLTGKYQEKGNICVSLSRHRSEREVFTDEYGRRVVWCSGPYYSGWE